MKSWLESLLIALSMYSAIPVKCLNWTEKNLRNAMVFFPLVGLLCGVGLWLVWLGLFVFWGCSHMAKKQFGGITGDLAGFFLVLSETVYLLGAALLGGVLA